MKNEKRLPELLSPAGSFEALVAAVSAGADAVYIGGKRFGARAFAKNFELSEIADAVSYCHLHSVKLYVTVNTLLSNSELQDAVGYCIELYRLGVDAVIAADLGLISLLSTMCPELELHASTQLSVHNTEGADIAHSLGAKRVVVARELSLDSIKSVTERSRPEIEVFLHGALCVSHSGQCLFSSLVGGRSGNRGECAQPCRLPYNNGYPISLSDLSLAGHIKELCDSGVSSLKIEGRMKSPSYVYTVTSVYRKLLDEHRNATRAEHDTLSVAFSRGGFTDGYFRGSPASVKTGVRSEADKAISRDAAIQTEFKPERVKVYARARIVECEPSQLTLFNENRSYTAFGDTPSLAISHAITDDEVKARLSKMGATYLSLDTADIELELGDRVNLSPGAINALRRDAAAGFADFSREYSEKPQLPDYSKIENPAGKSALFLNPAVIKSISPRNLSYFDTVFVPLFSEEAMQSELGIYLPPVVTDGEWSGVEARVAKCAAAGGKRALVTNISHIALVKKYGLIPTADMRMNITNSAARVALYSMGLTDAILSAELTLPAVRDIGGRVAVYGRIPLMLTEKCFMSGSGCGGKCPSFSLTDRRGAKFPIIYEYGHRNLILNSAVTYMADKRAELYRIGSPAEHYIFSTESAGEISEVISAYRDGAGITPSGIRRIGIRHTENKATKG